MMAYYNSTLATTAVCFPTRMRTAPTLISTSGTDYYSFERAGGTDGFNSLLLARPSTLTAVLYSSDGLSGTTGDAGNCWAESSGNISFNSEL